MKAEVMWTGPGLRLLGDVEDGPAIVVDSKGGTYGTHTGLTPMELVLLGLAGCTAMDVISIMAKKRQPLTNLQVKVEAELAEEYPKVFTKIRVEYIAYGHELDEQALISAIKLSEESYCSVQGMLKEVAEISSTYRFVEAVGPNEPGTLPEA